MKKLNSGYFSINRNRISISLLSVIGMVFVAGCNPTEDTKKITSAENKGHQNVTCAVENTVTAHVVALNSIYYYNRFGTYNPGGMIYALRRDVVDEEGKRIDGQSSKPDKDLAGHVELRADKRPRPIVLRVTEGQCLKVEFTNLLQPTEASQEWHSNPVTKTKDLLDSEEPKTNAASMHVNGLDYVGDICSDGANVGRNSHFKSCPSKTEATPGVQSANGALVASGETKTYTWYAKQEGGYLLYSMGAPGGGEGDGGQLGLGLFGSVNVQPKGAKIYRSQITEAEMKWATDKGKTTQYGQPIINYEATYPDEYLDATSKEKKKHNFAGDPILNIWKVEKNGAKEIIHSDLNAVVDISKEGDGDNYCNKMGEGNKYVCGKPYREFTVIFHDEITAVQAFRELEDNEDNSNPLRSLRDGMAINYGASGLGSMVVANRNRTEGKTPKYPFVGPAANCKECKLEEFFLSSWVNGDPAMVVDYDQGKPKALYPDDPSNVHHSYMGDPVRFRNLHAGPKETHVFHLHAHQWQQDKHDPQSVYLDSQTISPGASYNYDIHYGGSGNRNFTVGDSIFHCHLYPHFAQGMWELWRSHDVFENGSQSRSLPDAEITDGTPNPAIVPLPRVALPPMPNENYKGYPFYIAAEPGHRPTQPPLDFDTYKDSKTNQTVENNGGLPRHVILDAKLESDEIPKVKSQNAKICKQTTGTDLYEKGRKNSACIAERVNQQNGESERLFSLARTIKSASIRTFPSQGTEYEIRAMEFHSGLKGVNNEKAESDNTSYHWTAQGYPTCKLDVVNGKYDAVCDQSQDKDKRVLFHVNGQKRIDTATKQEYPGAMPGAPFANPCPGKYMDAQGGWKTVGEPRKYRAAYLQFDMTVNKNGWHDPQARVAVLENDIKATLNGTRPAEPLFFRAHSGECIDFRATNLVSNNLNLDDFQVYSPTDTIGQHIHLVKFDVTSSDGSGNGWNYEDGTFAADEVRERIKATQSSGGSVIDQNGKAFGSLKLTTLPMFKNNGSVVDKRGLCADAGGSDDNVWCGAQTTVQRWWADPLFNKSPEAGAKEPAHDRTIRTVFTHDHFGPSSHQHHGLYAALVVEPAESKWETVDGKTSLGIRNKKCMENPKECDGGPTNFAANIITPASGKDEQNEKREFGLAFADYAIVYTGDKNASASKSNQPVNAVNRVDADPPTPTFHTRMPAPEGISTKDPGTQLINYRNEPIPLRIGELDTSKSSNAWDILKQKPGGLGDLANVFNSCNYSGQGNQGQEIFTEKLPNQAGLTLCDIKNAENNTKTPELVQRQPGDPATPLLRAFEGDNVQLRLIQGAQEENHTFTMHGVKWLSQPDSLNSGWVNAQPIGISEHFEFNVKTFSPEAGSGPFANATTDHLYMSNATDNLWDGQWGIMRVYDPKLSDDKVGIRKFKTTTSHDAVGVCPPSARPQPFEVEAWNVRDLANHLKAALDVAKQGLVEKMLPKGALVYNDLAQISDPNAIIFIEAKQKTQIIDRLTQGKIPKIEPLILRVAAGDCVQVTLRNNLPEVMPDKPVQPSDPRYEDYRNTWSHNQMPPIVEGLNFNTTGSSSSVGLHAPLLLQSTRDNDGASVGINENSLAPACQVTDREECLSLGEDNSITYKWYAGEYQSGEADPYKPIEFGAIPLSDMGDVIKHSSHGAIGALIVEPKDSKFEASTSNCGPDKDSNASATICDNNGKPMFREFVVLYQDDISLRWRDQPLPNLRNADDAEDSGQKAFNYRTEPVWARLGASPSADPETMNEYDWSNVFSSSEPSFICDKTAAAQGKCDPATPVFAVAAGTPVRFRVMHPAGHPRNHAFTLFGHSWVNNPWACDYTHHLGCDSTVQGSYNPYSQNLVGSTNGIGPGRHVNILLDQAGGQFKVPGDYMYRSQEGFNFAGGLWGIMCVYDGATVTKAQCENRGMFN